jgi:hypothetical protein
MLPLPDPRDDQPRPRLTRAQASLTREVEVLDEFGQRRDEHRAHQQTHDVVGKGRLAALRPS